MFVLSPAVHDILRTSVARCSLFVLKVPLNTKQNKQTFNSCNTLVMPTLMLHCLGRQSVIWFHWWTPSMPTTTRVRWCWSWFESSSRRTRKWRRSYWKWSSSAVQRTVSNRSTSRTKFCRRSSGISGTSVWHWIDAIIDRLDCLIHKHGYS